MRTIARQLLRGLLPLALLVAAVGPVHAAANIIILNNDGAGEGFNDPAPAVPVGGNPGLTVGEQRLNAFQHAANIWGGILTSPVTIVVRAQFNPQTCTATSAVLGSAGPVTIHRDFTNAEFMGTWYHAALANKMAESDLSAANPDINATFNSNLNGNPACLGGRGWYYGYDGNEGTDVELLPVLLHEMGHGLGFSTTTSGTSGNYNGGFPSVYDRFLFDPVTGLHWADPAMTPAQRVASAVGVDKLAWDGPASVAAAGAFLTNRARLTVNAPGGIAGNYGANAASFGAPLTMAGLTGDVVLMEDGVAPINDGCEALVNGPDLNGKIALVDRGLCTFLIKAQAAQAAGAIGVIMVNNVAGPLAPGGADPAITIPVIGITQADGATLKANLVGLNVTLTLDPTLLAGADASGRPLVYTPNPFQGGSSVSHWDVTMTPNALMEPAINADLSSSVDLTRYHFEDIGWFPRVTATTLTLFEAVDRTDGILLRWQFFDPSDIASITVERGNTEDGPWAPVQTEFGIEGMVYTALDPSAEPGVTHYYRLNVMDRDGDRQFFGPLSGVRGVVPQSVAFVGAPRPNPAVDGAAVLFRIPQPEFVRLAVVDLRGGVVRTLENGMMAPGEHAVRWDGRSDGNQRVAPGVYMFALTTSKGTITQRVSVVR
jgi:hypothetical protein